MARYLLTVQLAPESMQALIDKPSDRIAYAARATEELGGKMEVGGNLVGGPAAEAFCVIEMPSPTSVAALTRMLHASGAVTNVQTRRVLSPEEDIEALRQAQEFQRKYKAPGRE